MFYVQIGAAALVVALVISLGVVPKEMADVSAEVSIWGILIFGFVQFVAMVLFQFRHIPRSQRIASLILGGGTFVLGMLIFLALAAAAGG